MAKGGSASGGGSTAWIINMDSAAQEEVATEWWGAVVDSFREANAMYEPSLSSPAFMGSFTRPTNFDDIEASLTNMNDVLIRATKGAVDETGRNFGEQALTHLGIWNDPSSSFRDFVLEVLGEVLTEATTEFAEMQDVVEGLVNTVENTIPSQAGSNRTVSLYNLKKGNISSSEMTNLLDSFFLAAENKAKNAVEDGSEQLVDEADAVLTTLRGSADSDTTTLMQSIIRLLTSSAYDIGVVIQNAITAAQSAVDSDVVDSLVEAFRNGGDSEYARAVSNFASGMAQVNSVQSSAFIFGLANLEADRLRQISDYRAKVSSDVYNKVLDQYMGVFAQSLSSGLQTFASALEQRTQAYSMLMNSYHAQLLDYVKQSVVKNLQSHSEFMALFENFSQGMRQTYEKGREIYTGNLGRIASGALNANVTDHVNHRQVKSQSYLNLYQSLLPYDLQRVETIKGQANSLMDILRVASLQNAEVAEASNTNQLTRMKFRLTMRQLAANIMAAGAGGTSVLPTEQPQPSVLGGALSGAASGAMAGAAFGGVGAPVGAAVGAIGGALGVF